MSIEYVFGVRTFVCLCLLIRVVIQVVNDITIQSFGRVQKHSCIVIIGLTKSGRKAWQERRKEEKIPVLY